MVSWWRGTEMMLVSVERGVGHGMQLNVDITVAMRCEGILVFLGSKVLICRCGSQCIGRDGGSNISGGGTYQGSGIIPCFFWNSGINCVGWIFTGVEV
jgi:hypothetical protein